MPSIASIVTNAPWAQLEESLQVKGYARLAGVLSPSESQSLIGLYDDAQRFRKAVVMEDKGYGKGEYKYFDYPLPSLVQTLREALYSPLAMIANRWMRQLHSTTEYPSSLSAMRARCHAHNQHHATPLLLKYEQGGFNALHQDIYGEVYFPLQAVINLSRQDKDYKGGEFVLVQRQADAQKRAHVVSPMLGEMIIFATHSRPVIVADSYQQSVVEHGIAEVSEGQRYALGIIFHDAED
ncbi:MAG: 2OG-Fe(II) oxygenase [Pseudomonadota bacterium]